MMLRRLVCCCLLITLLPVGSTHAQETADPVRQTSEKIVYLVDDTLITLLVSVSVTRAPADPLTWLIPVPTAPLSVEFAPADALARLEQTTEPYPSAPNIPCQLSQRSPVMGGDYRFPPPIIVGAEVLDYAVFGGAPADEVIADIGAADYVLDAWMEQTITAYPPETHFVLLRAAWPEAGEPQPEFEYRLPLLRVSYQADGVQYLTGNAHFAAESIGSPTTIWTVAASEYAQESTPAPFLPQWSLIQGSDHQVFDTGYLMLRQLIGEHAQLAYPNVRRRAVLHPNHQNFLTEYAGNLDGYFRDVFPVDLLPDGFTYEYVTRWYTETWLADAPLVISFVPAPDFPDVPRFVSLSEHVDPLVYWGCSSATALDHVWVSAVPDTRTRIDDLQLDVAHPAGWVLSTITWDTAITLYVLAPEPVDRAAIAAFFAGEPAPPFFAAFDFAGPPDIQRAADDYTQYWYAGAAADAFAQVFGVEISTDVGLRYWLYGGDACALEHAVVFGIFAPELTVAQRRDMLTYARSFQYFASADLPHTLFLDADFEGDDPILMIPYPAEWTPQLAADGHVRLVPADSRVTVIVARDPTDPAAWELRIEGDSTPWAAEIDAIRAGITTASACSVARGRSR